MHAPLHGLHLVLLALGMWPAAWAVERPTALPLARVGSCPSGYAVSGAYCRPGPRARSALPKAGSCPSGWSVSGDYCLAGAHARAAVPRTGNCPSGWSVSGGYCLSND